MANISKEMKKEIAYNLKLVLKNHPKINIRYSLAITSGTSLTMTIYESNIDLMKPFREKNRPQFGFGVGSYDIFCHTGIVGREIISDNYSGDLKSFMLDICDCINKGNHSSYSESSDTYYDGWYTSIFLGNKNRDFIYNTKYNPKRWKMYYCPYAYTTVNIPTRKDLKTKNQIVSEDFLNKKVFRKQKLPLLKNKIEKYINFKEKPP